MNVHREKRRRTSVEHKTHPEHIASLRLASFLGVLLMGADGVLASYIRSWQLEELELLDQNQQSTNRR